MTVTRKQDIVKGDGHFCTIRIFDYGQERPKCMFCDTVLVRIRHSPNHHLGGKPCGYLESWAYCYITIDVVEEWERRGDLLRLPEWSIV